MRTFVVGDMHGAHKAFLQCLERSAFDKENDTLISLGDIADGWPEVKECFDELLSIKKLIFVLGNHDQWLLFWATGDHPGDIWTNQGGWNTQKSYGFIPGNVPTSHMKLMMEDSKLWYVDDDNRLFVHGGINTDLPIERQRTDVCLWDRDLVHTAYKRHRAKTPIQRLTEFKEVYVGHTTTSIYDKELVYKPINFFEIWMMDTGAGYEGKLTMMDIDTKECFQSDKVSDLYEVDEHSRCYKRAKKIRNVKEPGIC